MKCEEMIYSNDYVDLIVNNYNETNPKQEYQADACVNEIVEKIAIYHGKRLEEYLTNLETIPYSSIPKLYGLMDSGNMDAIGVKQVHNSDYLGLNGNGTIVGIIDTGIAYDNPLFFDANGQSRIGVIWDQTIPAGEKNGLHKINPSYGTVYYKEDINKAIVSERPYEIVPSRDENGHGTFLAGIAAGGVDKEQDFTGIAFNAEIAVVKLKETKPYLRDYFQIDSEVPAYEETDIIYGIQYLVAYAQERKKPISILLGVGTSNGGHQGFTYLEIYLSRLLENVGVFVSVPAGNEGASRLHYYGKMEKTESLRTVECNIAEGQKGISVELWGNAPSIFSLGIVSPRGERIERIPPRFGEEEQVVLPLSKSTVYVAYQISEAYSGEEFIFIRIVNPTPGIWRFQVYSEEENEKSFHMWMPLRQFLRDETFFLDASSECTITSPGNVGLVFTITAYNHVTGSLFLDDSRGYTANNRIKPDLAAPGANIMGPGLRNNYVRKSGTSVATAHAAGVCALFLQWDLENYREGMFFTGQIQSFFLRGASRSDERVYPNNSWGYGVIDVEQTVRMFQVSNYPLTIV